MTTAEYAATSISAASRVLRCAYFLLRVVVLNGGPATKQFFPHSSFGAQLYGRGGFALRLSLKARLCFESCLALIGASCCVSGETIGGSMTGGTTGPISAAERIRWRATTAGRGAT